MTLNTFRTSCKQGSKVYNLRKGNRGIVVKLSTTLPKALVAYSDWDIVWEDYYNLDLMNHAEETDQGL